MMNKFNNFHLVNQSPWPIMSAVQMKNCMLSLILLLNKKEQKTMILMNNLILAILASMWWKNTSMESNKEGFHNSKVMEGLKIGMLMFISSEVLFFMSFFWCYFHSMFSPNVELGQEWPPMMIKSFNPKNVPLLNTMILISSGFSITWSHHLMLKNKMTMAKNLLMVTCALGVYFTVLQKMEYNESQFCISDSSYGNIFFMATGFHGIHVMIGTCFLLVNMMMTNKKMNNKMHHMGFELAAWYWHFVDVVWLFLYLSMYWWGM